MTASVLAQSAVTSPEAPTHPGQRAEIIQLKPVESPTPRSSSLPSQGSIHLDALRGAAALLVFLNHTRALYFAPVLRSSGPVQNAITQTQTAAITHAPAGQIKVASEAVILFFVLSGYLVGGSVLRLVRTERWSWAGYLSRRLTRLYAVLVPAIVLGLCFDHLGLHLFGAASIYGAPAGLDLVPTANLSARLAPSVVLGNLLFLQGLRAPILGSNVALWSLSCEFWYYIAFPLAVLALRPGRKPGARLLCIVGTVLVLCLIGASAARLFPVWLLGAAINDLPRLPRPHSAKLLLLASTLALLGSMAAVRLLPVPAKAAEYILAILCSAFLYTAVQQVQPAAPGIYRRVASYFSDISYSLYLYHLPLAVFLCGLLNSPWHPWRRTPAHLAEWLFSDLLVLAIATQLWKLFEAKTDLIRFPLIGR